MRDTCCVLVLLLVVLSCLGCYSTWDVAPKDLHTLKGFQANAEIPIRDTDGTVFMFDEGTDLTFERSKPGEGVRYESHRFSSIGQVDSNALSGVDDRNRGVTVDLTRVENVEAAKFSVGKTVGLSVGITVGVAAVAGIVLAVASSSLSGGGGGWGGFSIGYAGAAPLEREGSGVPRHKTSPPWPPAP
jgi:hypothetical protein